MKAFLTKHLRLNECDDMYEAVNYKVVQAKTRWEALRLARKAFAPAVYDAVTARPLAEEELWATRMVA